MDEIVRLKGKKKTQKKKKNYFSKFMIRLMVTVIVTLLCMIGLKQNKHFYDWFQKNVYEKNINFAYINKVYKKYFGSSFPFADLLKNQTETVFEEKLQYEEANLYLDGVNLKVADKYLVPTLDMGMVIFVGEKEGYGNTIIIEQSDGVEVWYGNMKNISVNLYDLKEKGDYLGEAEGNLYLVFKKDGEILDYKNYI